MATTANRKTAAKSKAAKAKTSKAATRKATRGATEAKKATGMSADERKARDAERTEVIVSRREDGDSWSDIASDLGITAGKAQFLMMLHRVATGDVKAWPKAALKDEESIGAQIKKDRDAANEFSSWGWIAARSGLSEPTLKRIHEEQNSWKPKTENISIVRAEKNGGTTKATAKNKATGKTATAKAKTPAKAAAKAKAKARAKGRAADPTS